MIFLKPKSLQSKLSLLLLLPVFIVLFLGGLVSFLYVRQAMLDQWNEVAVLKLQRAAHDIEMRLAKPIDMMELFFETGSGPDTDLRQDWIVKRLKALDGVVGVNVEFIMPHEHSSHMGMDSMEHFHHGRFSKITEPRFDSDTGQKTVSLISSLLDAEGKEIGLIEIVLAFDYLIEDVVRLGWWQSDMACIVDQSGNYLVHTNLLMESRQQLGDTNDPLESKILEGLKGNPFGTVSSSGHPPERIAGYYNLSVVPWTIVVFAPGKKILQPIIQFRNIFLFGSLILFIFILVLIRSHVGKIVSKIKRIAIDADKVAKGEYGRSIKVGSRDEIGQLVHSYNSMVAGLKERDHIRNTFGRYIDPEFAKRLMSQPEAIRLGGKKKDVVILISDIRGFTSKSEGLNPEATLYVLNQYFSHMIRVIRKHNGIIVDFIGDAILVFFEPIDGSLSSTINKSVLCASEMQKCMIHFNQQMEKKGLPHFDIGIGINAGEVIVGNIGSSERAKYGIVGSAVNLTQRVQEKAQAKEIIITESVLKHLNGNVNILKSFQEKLKGYNSPLNLNVINQHSMIYEDLNISEVCP